MNDQATLPVLQPNYYWLRHCADDRLTIARFDGQFWSFIGSDRLIEDDETDEDGDRYMDRYSIVQGVAMPSQ